MLSESMRTCCTNRDTPTIVATAAFKTYEAFQRREETLMVTLDLEDAYNRVQYTTLLAIML